MKTCQCCGTVSPDDVATCPACGEASWIKMDVRPGTAPSLTAPSPPDDAAPMFTRTDDRRSKRGRR